MKKRIRAGEKDWLLEQEQENEGSQQPDLQFQVRPVNSQEPKMGNVSGAAAVAAVAAVADVTAFAATGGVVAAAAGSAAEGWPAAAALWPSP